MASPTPALSAKAHNPSSNPLAGISKRFVDGHPLLPDGVEMSEEMVRAYWNELQVHLAPVDGNRYDDLRDRFVSQQQTSKINAQQEFNSGEHFLLGDHLIKDPQVKEDMRGLPVKLEFLDIVPERGDHQGGSVAQFSFGAIIALAGDFICLPGTGEDSIISRGANEAEVRARFLKAFSMLTDPKMISSYVSVTNHFKNEALAVRAAMDADPECEKTLNPSDKVYKKWYGFLHGPDIVYGAQLADRSYLLRYVDALANNMDHFNFSRDPTQDGPALKVYKSGHRAALDEAMKGTPDALNRAMCMEAFACHFLTDSFAGGHVRVPRAELLEVCNYWIAQGKRAGWKAHDQHDEDGDHGVYICSGANPLPWLAYGDGSLFHRDNRLNRYMIFNAMRTALLEIKEAFEKKVAPAQDHTLAVFTHLPYYAYKDPRNNPPMFRVIQLEAKDPKTGLDYQVQKRTSKIETRPPIYADFMG
jgi:hypothetical protein